MAKSKTAPAKAKSNTARPSVSKSVSFNPKIVALIAIVLVAALGFVYVFFSKAATLGSWGPDNLEVWHGTKTTKANGTKQISAAKAPDPVVGAWSSINVILTNYQTSNTNITTGTYCATGSAPAGSRISAAFGTYGQKGGGGGEAYDPTVSQAINNGAAGAFEICVPLPAALNPEYIKYTYVGFNLYAPGVSSTLVVDKIYQKSSVVTWYGDNMNIFIGNKATKSDLTRQAVGTLNTESGITGTWNRLNANVSWIEPGIYCAVGSAPAGSYVNSFVAYGEKGADRPVPYDPKQYNAALSVNSSGRYEICKQLPVRTAQQQQGQWPPSYFGVELWAPTTSQLTVDYIYLKQATSPSTSVAPTPSPIATVKPTATPVTTPTALPTEVPPSPAVTTQ